MSLGARQPGPDPAFARFDPSSHGHVDPAIVIRPAAASDVPAILAVMTSRGRAVPEAHSIEAWIGDSDRLVVVAVRPDVVGYATVVMLTADAPADPSGRYVSGLTVLPAARRRGAGVRLLTAVRDRTWEEGCALHSVVSGANPASLALHLSVGFTVLATGPTMAGVAFDCGTGHLLRAASPGSPTSADPMPPRIR